jgi:predicted O-methyltransferase YrrM
MPDLELAMDQDSWKEMDEFLCSRLVGKDIELEAALDSSIEAGLPSAHVPPNQGNLLHLLAKAQRAQRILEVGTLGGYSTIWLARALSGDGLLITLEANPKHVAIAHKNIERAGLSHRVTILPGRAVETLEQLIDQKTEPFDFVFIDADKVNYPLYLHMAIGLSRQGTLIVCDNIVREGRVADESCIRGDVTGIRQFLDLAGNHPRLETTAFQTVGSKGWDGLSVSLVTA